MTSFIQILFVVCAAATIVQAVYGVESLVSLGKGCCRSTNAKGNLVSGKHDDITGSTECECMAQCWHDPNCEGFEFNPADQNRCELHRMPVTAADASNTADCGQATCYSRRRQDNNDNNTEWVDVWKFVCPDVFCSVERASLAWTGPDRAPPAMGGMGASNTGEPAGDGTLVTVEPAFGDFGPQMFWAGLDGSSVTRDIVVTEPSTACGPLSNSDLINGKVALVLRGGCNFWHKALYAQLAGATHVIIYNTAGSLMITRMVCPDPTVTGSSIVTPNDGKEYKCDQDITIPTFMIDHSVGKKLGNSLDFSCVPPDESAEGEEEEATDDDAVDDDGDNNDGDDDDDGDGDDGDGDDRFPFGPPTTTVLCNNKADPADICKESLKRLCKSAQYGARLSEGCPVLCNACTPASPPPPTPPTTPTPPPPIQTTTAKNNNTNDNTNHEHEQETTPPASTQPATTTRRAGPKPTGNALDAGSVSDGSEPENGGGENDGTTAIIKISTTTAPNGDIANNRGADGAGAGGSIAVDWTIWGAAVAAGGVLILVVIGYCTWSICKKRGGGGVTGNGVVDINAKKNARGTVPPASPRTSADGGGGGGVGGGGGGGRYRYRSDSILILAPATQVVDGLRLNNDGTIGGSWEGGGSAGGAGGARSGIRTTVLGSRRDDGSSANINKDISTANAAAANLNSSSNSTNSSNGHGNQQPRGRSTSAASRSANDNLPSVPGLYDDANTTGIPAGAGAGSNVGDGMYAGWENNALYAGSGGGDGALPPPIGAPPIRPLTTLSERSSADYEDVDGLAVPSTPSTPISPMYEQPANTNAIGDMRQRTNSYLTATDDDASSMYGLAPRASAQKSSAVSPPPLPSAPLAPPTRSGIGYDYSTSAAVGAGAGKGGVAVAHDYATKQAATAAPAPLYVNSFGVCGPASASASASAIVQSDYELDEARGEPGQVMYGTKTNSNGEATAVVIVMANGEPVYELDAPRGMGQALLYAPVTQGEEAVVVVDNAAYNPELYEDVQAALHNHKNSSSPTRRHVSDESALKNRHVSDPDKSGTSSSDKSGTTSSLEL